MSNGLDPDQAGQNVGPDLCLNCLQRLSADDKSHGWQARVNNIFFLLHRFYCLTQETNVMSTKLVLCMYTYFHVSFLVCPIGFVRINLGWLQIVCPF